MSRRAAAAAAAMALAIGCRREVREDALERGGPAMPPVTMQAFGGSPRGPGLPHSTARSSGHLARARVEGRGFGGSRNENRLRVVDVDADVESRTTATATTSNDDVVGHDPGAALDSGGDLGGALESAWAFDNLGSALLLAGRPAQTSPPLERAVALRGDQPILLSNLGLAYEAQGRLAEARGALEWAMALAPGRTSAVDDLARVRAAERAEAAAREADAGQVEGGAAGSAGGGAQEKSAGDDLAGADFMVRGEPGSPLDPNQAGEAEHL